MDLGTPEKDMGSPVGLTTSSGGDDGAPKVNYPGLSIRDAAADELRAQYDLKLGDTITMTVTAKVTGQTQDQYSNSIALDIMSADNITTAGDMEGAGAPDPSPEHEAGETPEEEEEEHATGKEAKEDIEDVDNADGTMTDAGEEKALGYKRPKKRKGTFDVDTSAKSFID